MAKKASTKKAATKNLKTRVFAGNMTNFKSDRKYSLAIIARSGFMHLLSGEDQRKTLLNIREHLTDGGILTLNTFQPFPIIQAAQMQSSLEDYRFRLEYTNKDGLKEKIYCSETYDYISQVMTGNWKFETYDNNGKIIVAQNLNQAIDIVKTICGFILLKKGVWVQNIVDKKL